MPDLRPVEFKIEKVVAWEEWRHECLPRLRYAKELKIPHLPQLLPHNGKCAIVGAGPSVTKFVDQIREIGRGPLNILMSVNGAHEWLRKQGIVPNIHVIFENDLEEAKTALGGEPVKGTTYYIASHCARPVFTQLKNYKRVLYHAFLSPQEYQRAIARYFPGEFMVAGGYATMFRSLTIAIILGYRDFDLFGIDSSFEESSHLDGYAIANREPKVTIWGADPEHKNLKKFTTQGGLAYQANEFIEYCKANQANLRLRVHGDGLLRYVHESRYPEQYQT